MAVFGCWTHCWFSNCIRRCTGLKFRLKIVDNADVLWHHVPYASCWLSYYAQDASWNELEREWMFICDGSACAEELYRDVMAVLGCSALDLNMQFEIPGLIGSSILGEGYSMSSIDNFGHHF